MSAGHNSIFKILTCLAPISQAIAQRDSSLDDNSPPDKTKIVNAVEKVPEDNFWLELGIGGTAVTVILVILVLAVLALIAYYFFRPKGEDYKEGIHEGEKVT